jgi:protein transport protein SEC61 subunit alpha
MGVSKAILLAMQITFSGFMIMMLEEMSKKGFGIGSAMNMFIATHVCQNIVWSTLSFSSFKTQNKSEYYGSFIGYFLIVALIHELLSNENKLSALQNAFYRANLPNLN